MHEIFGIIPCSRAELLDLLEDKALAPFLVANLIESVDNDEEIGLLIAGVPEELPAIDSRIASSRRARRSILCAFTSCSILFKRSKSHLSISRR